MNPFFTAEDFNLDVTVLTSDIGYIMAKRANAKLEREGKFVYGTGANPIWTYYMVNNDSHQALLINIESIEKCQHPIEKVSIKRIRHLHEPLAWIDAHICECGAKVRPKEFEEIIR